MGASNPPVNIRQHPPRDCEDHGEADSFGLAARHVFSLHFVPHERRWNTGAESRPELAASKHKGHCTRADKIGLQSNRRYRELVHCDPRKGWLAGAFSRQELTTSFRPFVEMSLRRRFTLSLKGVDC
jgi:hypothetical protein